MAQDKPSTLDQEKRLASQIHKAVDVSDTLEPPELGDPNEDVYIVNTELNELLLERKDQRRLMLNFVMTLTSLSFALLVVVVVWQGIVRLQKPDYEIINTSVFNILAVSVFGQVISVIFAIVKSLWDDTEYLKRIS